MTARQLTLRLLKYIGVTSIDPDEGAEDALKRTLVDGDIDDAVAAINGALQEIYALGPAFLSEKQMASVIRAPATVTVAVTQYSTACTVSGYASWMAGCAVKITGDDADNELVSGTELVRPYMGGSGTVSATVYCDSILLSESVQSILEPVTLPNTTQLVVANTREEFINWNAPHRYGNTSMAGYYQTNTRSVGEPAIWFGETRFDGLTLRRYMKLNPLPAQAYPITYRVKLKPTALTAEDIGDPETDPEVPFPGELHESILLPFALQRWTAHPAFGNDAAKAEIQRQYALARQLLENMGASVTPVNAYYL